MERLLVRGLSTSEIAQSIDPPVDERTVQRDIARIRRAQAAWWRDNSQLGLRLAHYLKEQLDILRELMREGWLVAFEAKENLKTRVAGLNVVLGAAKAVNEVLGFTGVSMRDEEMQQAIVRNDREIANLKRLVLLAQGNASHP